MFPDDPRKIEVIRQWVQKAEHDLLASVQVLKLGKETPIDIVCFHAQQCVEKYLKALLVNHDLEPPKTHNLPRLLDLLPASARLALTQPDQLRLTD